MYFAVLTVSVALAQGKNVVPPPPKPADEAPSLEVTMKFIQDKLNSIGPVNFTLYSHVDAVGDLTAQFHDEVTTVVADPSTCQISYRWKEEVKGHALNLDISFFLKDVKDLVVLPEEQHLKQMRSADSESDRADPPVFVLKVRKKNKDFQVVLFSDEQMANRVAKAIVHAVELCGGGGKPEPF
jgi:hypothetical protein